MPWKTLGLPPPRDLVFIERVAVVLVAIIAAILELVAVYSTVEIGPNLLAAITSIVGLVTIVVQLALRAHIKGELDDIRRRVRSNTRKLETDRRESDPE